MEPFLEQDRGGLDAPNVDENQMSRSGSGFCHGRKRVSLGQMVTNTQTCQHMDGQNYVEKQSGNWFGN